jgi:hypothetical protein
MTKGKKFKSRVRARAEKTGESYQAARRHFGRFEETENRARPSQLSSGADSAEPSPEEPDRIAPWGRETKPGATPPIDALTLTDGDFRMKTTPVRIALKRQLMMDRDEVVASREMVRTGSQPPHGFDAKVCSSLNTIASQRLQCSAKAQGFSEQISSRPHHVWDLHDIDNVITIIDNARGELESPST